MTNVWASVARVSRMGERKEDAADFHSLREQREANEGAIPNGDIIEHLPPELDVSGGLPLEQRPSLLAAVEGVEAGKYAGIVVAYQSRLGRDVEYEEQVWRRVEAAGGRILMAMDGLDTGTVDGTMVRRIRSAINTAERERHAERFDRLRKYATEQGIWQNKRAPKGYDRDPQTRRLVPNADAHTVVAAFKARAAGESWTVLARSLGVTLTGARKIIENRVYLGELRIGKYHNPKAHPALVDVETFQAAQGSTPRPTRSGRATPLLAGLLRCESCGHAMTKRAGAVNYSAATPKVAAYHCPTSHGCPAPTGITARLVDDYVLAIARRELAKLDVDASSAREGVERARTELAEAERERVAYHENVSATDSMFAVGDRVRKDRVDRATEALRIELSLAPDDYSGLTAVEAFEGRTPQGKNAVLRGLLECVVVRRGRMSLEDRVRVLAHGTPIVLPRRKGNVAMGICPIPFPNADDPGVLRPFAVEDVLEGAGSRRKVSAH